MEKSIKDILKEQIELLAEWNKEHISGETEQVRKNAETIERLVFGITAHCS